MNTSEDPRLSTEQYLHKHQLHGHMECILANLLVNKPANPKQYIIGQLEKIKVAGTKSLFDAEDLSTMFRMFDITKRGTVTEQQAVNALKTVLGSRAPEAPADAATKAMYEPEFISFMQRALQEATLLSRGGS